MCQRRVVIVVRRFFIKKIKWLAGLFLLCVSLSCVYGISLAYAQSSIVSGTSGTCEWKYEPVFMEGQKDNVSYRLVISPAQKDNPGVLENWEGDTFSLPPWQASCYRNCRLKTTCIEIAKTADGSKAVKAPTCVNMFSGFTALIDADLSGLDVAGVTNMNGMFSGCDALQSIEFGEFDTSSVTTMSCMFKGCGALFAPSGIWAWNTSNVVDMSYMFCGCSSLAMLDLKGWSTSSNPNMTGMFDTYGQPSGLFWDNSLVCLRVGKKFHFGAFLDPRFRNFSRSPLSDKRFRWFHVDYAAQGTLANPHGKEFASFDHVVEFHNSAAEGPDSETYVRSDFCEQASARNDETIARSKTQRSDTGESDSSGESDIDTEGWDSEGWYSDEWDAEELEPARPEPVGASHTEGWGTPEPEPVGEPSVQVSSVQVSEPVVKTQESGVQASELPVKPKTRESGVQASESAVPLRTRESSIRAKQRRLTGWYKCDNMVFYFRDGKTLTGWQELCGTMQTPSSLQKSWFYFNDAGVMLTGRCNLVGGFKNAQGVQEWNWFYFDTTTGAEIRGWHKIVEDGVERWYYYRDGDGIMLKGQHELVGGFNQGMNWFYFDEKTGIQIRGWKYIDYQDKWCYYSLKDGTMLKGQHELQGGDNGGKNWFYFDEVTGARLCNCWKQIPSQGKTCYYGSDGAMYKGWREVDGKHCYFDEATGALM